MTGEPKTAVASSFWGLLEAVPDAMVVVGRDGVIQHVNEQTSAVFGYARDELIGRPIEVLLPERLRELHHGHRAFYIRDPKRRKMDSGLALSARRKDGTEFPADITLAPAELGGATVVAAVIRDVSDRKRSEAMIAETEARYQSALENMIEAAQIVDFEWRYLYVNAAAVRNGRQSKEEMLGRTMMDRYPGIETTEMYATLHRCMLERTATLAEFEFTYADGTTAWFEFSVHPVPEGLVILSLDITARKRADHEIRALNADLERRVHARTAQLEEANQFLAAVVENIPNMIFVKDAERLTFVRFNKAGEALLGLSRDDLLGKNDFDLFPAAEAEFFQAKDRETLENRATVDIAEEPLETSRGRRWVHTRKVPILGADGTPMFLLGISEDITERRQAEEMKRRLVSIVASSDDAIIGTNLAGEVTTWNRGAERMFGYSAEEIVGREFSFIIPTSRSSEASQLTERVRNHERIEHFETLRRHKDGRELDISVSVSPILDSAGTVIGISRIARDITETKQTRESLARAKDAAEAANRELEAFSYSVAHDLRAPLRSIDGFSQALLEDYLDKLDADGKRYLSFIRESAQQMAQLIDDLLALSRVTRSELHCEEIDMTTLARLAVKRLQRREPQRNVDVAIEEGLAGRGDPRLLVVALDNLLGNAWKFTGRREDARIEVGRTSKDGELVYFVRDNGVGFDMAFAGKLFGVFQRLHSVAEFEGTGVGLAIVQRVVRRHGGRVWAEGAVGAGATFYFTVQAKERMP
jgi:PAS domain S-box-containing protein